jgi:very-short-patch-repair endonuclease
MDHTEPIDFAKYLRQTANSYEQLLWQLLRNRQRCGKKFRR